MSSKNRSNAMWSIIKKHTTSATNCDVNITLNNDNKVKSRPTEVAVMFNKYFSSIGKIDPQTFHNLPSLLPNNITNSIKLTHANSQEVLNTINSYKIKFSAGVNEFPEFLIKRRPQVIIDPFTHIINFSLTSGVFPKILKESKIKPLFKKGEKNIQNYKPIALLSTFSKILEKIFFIRLVDFLSKNNILSQC